MACTIIPGVGIACSRGRKRQHFCSVRGCQNPGTRQCDYRGKSGQVCDRYICVEHATRLEPNVDYCPGHAQRYQDELAL